MLPVFCASMQTLFEGNQQILNIYAETDKPQKFFTYATIIIIVLTLGVAVSVGYVGYLAFGNNQRSLLLYNLPNEDPWAITVELCYVVTMAGSFVLVIQPIFHIIEQSNVYRYGSFHSPEEHIEIPPAQNDTPIAQDDIIVENQFCKKEAGSDDVTERQP